MSSKPDNLGLLCILAVGKLVLPVALAIAMSSIQSTCGSQQPNQSAASASGLEGERIDGMTGVWVDGCKLAAVGVRAKKWVTYHGLALNIHPDLQPFSFIVPCGISSKPVGSVQGVLENQMGQKGAEAWQPREVQEAALLKEYSYGLMEAFEETFAANLQLASDEALAGVCNT